ncbi:hypothetical protein LWI28_011535 [Acer negundo]|uniref:Uncharacterized protein n=1 Tax=Acer negundo TaxID=4023 RepID=A0AAD5I5U2_ACENE|nr:hypothetical protein LWI28_011535 [Acer negundo]
MLLDSHHFTVAEENEDKDEGRCGGRRRRRPRPVQRKKTKMKITTGRRRKVESIGQDLDEVVPLPWSPKAEKADIIIYWTILGVRVDSSAVEEEEAEDISGAEKVFTAT